MLRQIAGQGVWVEQIGTGADTPHLFVHCSLAQHETFLPVAKALDPAEAILFDLPGHGRSDDWTDEDYQTDVLRIVEGLLDRPAHIIGHSFGGTVGLRLAVERPDLVARLSLIEPVMFAAASDHARKAHDAAFAPFVAAWQRQDRDTATKLFLEMWGAGRPWGDLPLAARQKLASQIHMIPAAAPAIEDDVHGILNRLEGVTCPVDLIEGTASPAIMSAIMDGLSGRLPQAQRTIVPLAGHMLPMTHVQNVVSVLKGR